MPRTTHDTPRPAQSNDESRAKLDLERRYGSIGISAVAAAARYHGDVREPARMPAPVRQAAVRKDPVG